MTTRSNHKSDDAVSLGKLQSNFESAARNAKATERALTRAQEARDSSAEAARAARQALIDGQRTVLG